MSCISVWVVERIKESISPFTYQSCPPARPRRDAHLIGDQGSTFSQ